MLKERTKEGRWPHHPALPQPQPGEHLFLTWNPAWPHRPRAHSLFSPTPRAGRRFPWLLSHQTYPRWLVCRGPRRHGHVFWMHRILSSLVPGTWQAFTEHYFNEGRKREREREGGRDLTTNAATLCRAQPFPKGSQIYRYTRIVFFTLSTFSSAVTMGGADSLFLVQSNHFADKDIEARVDRGVSKHHTATWWKS